MQLEPPTINRRSAGAEWVHRFLFPALNQFFGSTTPLTCLQLWPDDETEAIELEACGNRCQMITPTAPPLLFDSESFDLAFTGRFPARLTNRAVRIAMAREIARVLRPGGAFLTVLGNRWCPIDLSRNGPLLHGPRASSALSAYDAKEIFLDSRAFATLDTLSPSGHFAWRRAPALRPVGAMLEIFWKFADTPSRRWLLKSFFNPTLILWLTRK